MAEQEENKNFEDSSEKKEQKSSKKRWHKMIFFLFITILFFGGAYFLWSFLQSPAVGVIRAGKLPAKEESFDQGKEQKHFSGEYVSFSYPGTYTEREHKIPETGPIKESIFLSNTDTEGKKIAVTIEKRTEESFSADPSYQMRMNDPKTYSRMSIDFDGTSGFLFTKNSQVFEQTAFFRKKDSILAISITSPFSIDTLREDLNNILKNLEWKAK